MREDKKKSLFFLNIVKFIKLLVEMWLADEGEK
jgi:hypothetical protein